MPKHDFTEKPLVKFILMLIGMALSVAILILSIVTVISIYGGEGGEVNLSDTSTRLIWIFAAVGLMSIVFFLKLRTKINLIKCVILLLLNAAIGVMSYLAKDIPYLFAIGAGVYCLTIIISRVFSIIVRPSARSIILNLLIIASLALVGYGFFKDSFANGTFDIEASMGTIITFECVVVAVVSIAEASEMLFSALKLKILAKIIVSTFSLEILFGLLTMIAVFSFILTRVEGWAYVDALWYCFAVVTTIGFGDMVVLTPVGRVLTVVLGIYGLVVVAVITSIIVNFYNEVNGRKDRKELKEIVKEEEDQL